MVGVDFGLFKKEASLCSPSVHFPSNFLEFKNLDLLPEQKIIWREVWAGPPTYTVTTVQVGPNFGKFGGKVKLK